MTTPAPAQTVSTELLPTLLLTLRNILCFLLSFLFTWPGTGLAGVWLWDLCVVIDSLAGETSQLSVALLQQFVTTQIYPSPQCHKFYRKETLEMPTALLNFLTSRFENGVGDKILMYTHTNSWCDLKK